MGKIDATARVADGATIAEDVEIGPYCIVGSHVELGPSVRLLSHVSVTGHTSIGARTVVYPFASLGTPPQSVHYRGGDTRLVIGADCQIREGCTANIGTEDGRGITRIGDECFLMVGSHVGHDCEVGNHVTFANNAVLAGHVSVGDYVVFGGQAAVRQFVRIGAGVMIAGLTGIRADIIPWSMVEGRIGHLAGLNIVGLRRRGFGKADIQRLRQTYQHLFFGPGTFRSRVEAMAADKGEPPVTDVIEFIHASGDRPLTMGARRAAANAEP
ncbi:MAG: acyl-ACP--UDP-N-acetylglucosamine O-acyltransferase [Rhodoplanes sp.]